MLQIKDITKRYKTGPLVQTALDGVSLNLRDSEFVAVLGPSGSGKTTLLNIIGGLDRYDTGDLVINDISTRMYRDRDWDSYRNHTVGFVFQSYNLIPHQSILSNVELALTISGIPRSQRRKRSVQALTEVGLGDQLHKRPNQLSGGQMQRVAIARALVNDPEILLADEPTGALDTRTSIQVMELLKKVAQKRLVVMVTHNPELAACYSTRVVKLSDGKIISDSNPYEPHQDIPLRQSKPGKARMGFLTSLSLSFNNLRTKKARTLLTSFAGSIGVIGIALILALSNGVNRYITDMQKDTMSSYPITIKAEAIDLSALMGASQDSAPGTESTDRTGITASHHSLQQSQQMLQSVTTNDLTAFKKYLEDPGSEIAPYIGENGIVYTYNVRFSVFSRDAEGIWVDTDADPLELLDTNPGEIGSVADMPAVSPGAENFSELMKGGDGQAVSRVITDSYEVLYGHWPQAFNEVVLVAGPDASIDVGVLYRLGFVTAAQYRDMAKQIESGQAVEEITLDYAQICAHPFYLVPACDWYIQKDDGSFRRISGIAQNQELPADSIELRITAVVRAKEDAANAGISTPIGYTSLLTDQIIRHTDASAVVLAQEANREVNVLNGLAFSAADEAQKAADAAAYLSGLSLTEKAALYGAIFGAHSSMDEAQAALALELWLENDPDPRILVSLYDRYVSGATYEGNMRSFGKVSYDAPDAISIYADSFEDKEAISEAIAHYNSTVGSESRITYTDYVALLISSITSMVNAISYVLIAFVAVSLVVSCIMIGIITHISVLERTKEIGILRAIGASKKNISQVFNAETVIIGLCSGLLGVGISLALTIPINRIIAMMTDNADIHARLPISSAVILVCISVLITVIGGLIPARKAAKKDPVVALRTE